jgi:hypothetical protein
MHDWSMEPLQESWVILLKQASFIIVVTAIITPACDVSDLHINHVQAEISQGWKKMNKTCTKTFFSLTSSF